MKKTLTSTLILSLTFISGCFGHKVPEAENIKINSTPEMLKRGEYLAINVSSCVDCHSLHDETSFGRPYLKEGMGKGGDVFDHNAGLPGNIYSKNITPEKLSEWSDGEILRAMTTGVSKDGTALFPIMPYLNFGRMSKEDVYSIIAYIRTLKPVKNEIPARTLDFPLNFIVNAMPKEASFSKLPDKTNTVAMGAYLVNAAGCSDCHTPSEKGTPIAGKEFAGGMEFKLPTRGLLRSANITPDKTGIGSWSKYDFIKKFKEFKSFKVKDGEFQTVMPWGNYSGMTEEDLGAIYDYLRTLKPVSNTVEHFTPEKK